VLRKTGDSEGWNALMEADRLDLSFEDMVLNADEPARRLFTDEDRRLAAQILRLRPGRARRPRPVRSPGAARHVRTERL